MPFTEEERRAWHEAIAVRHYHSTAEGAERRIAWATVVTLLRAVGHVLDKVEGSRSDFLRAAIDECWSELRAGGAEYEILNHPEFAGGPTPEKKGPR